MLVTWGPWGDPEIVLAVCYRQMTATLLKWISLLLNLAQALSRPLNLSRDHGSGPACS